MIAFAALAISVASWFADPDGVILFGILHCIAVSSVIGLLFLRAPLALVIAFAIFCLAAPSFLTSPAFNGLGWVWLGLGSERLALERLQPAPAVVRHGAGRHCDRAHDPAR